MKKILPLTLFLALLACSQDPAKVIYGERGEGLGRADSSKASYSKGEYVRTRDNRIVRDLARTPDKSYAQGDDDLGYGDGYSRSGSEVRTVLVRQGDTLRGIANSHGLTLQEIAKLNNLNPSQSIQPGQRIIVARDRTGQHYYTVKTGDNLYRIAYRNSMRITDLARDNNLKKPYDLQVGQKLLLAAGRESGERAGVVEEPEDGQDPERNERLGFAAPGRAGRHYYTVRTGDNLYRIAYRNSVNFTDLVRNNNLKKPYDLQVGQKLLLPSGRGNSGNGSLASGRDSAANRQGLERVESKGPDSSRDSHGSSAGAGSGFIWPVEGEVSRDPRKQPGDGSSDSISIKAPRGTRIKSIASGEVAYAGDELKGFGRIIILKHDGGWISVYGHCESVNVKVKDMVQRGQIIGTVGETGNASEPQLYFSLRKGRIAVDPTKYLSKR
ncbi:MAG: LysM peptidoglycan-binding domain-containing protein [Rickettsiales bacterium]|jgi:murein DD-endopeptidase MepM/ murein hydrolase activator NlpD|nr:LysM peptidoglycan-binding domain-containing protein [Rickettsiales bacterium]